PCWPKRQRRPAVSSSRRRTLSGAATPATSPIPTATSGRSPGIRTGKSPPTAASDCRAAPEGGSPAAAPARLPRTAARGAGCAAIGTTCDQPHTRACRAAIGWLRGNRSRGREAMDGGMPVTDLGQPQAIFVVLLSLLLPLSIFVGRRNVRIRRLRLLDNL